MGCDVHCFVEVKFRGEPGWHCYSQPDVDRDYRLFEKMAGVRGDLSEAIRQPRGLPKDVSIIVKKEYASWGSDTHTPSWLALSDMRDLETWGRVQLKTLSVFGDLRGNSFSAELPPDIANVRLVFWFDN